MTGTCPRCGADLAGITTRAPGDHRARPCGCQVSGATARHLAAENDNAEPQRLAADGGQDGDSHA